MNLIIKHRHPREGGGPSPDRSADTRVPVMVSRLRGNDEALVAFRLPVKSAASSASLRLCANQRELSANVVNQHIRHPELVSGSISQRSLGLAARWMLKQVQHDVVLSFNGTER